MKQKLLIATHNPGKFSEIAEVLHDLSLQLVSLSDIGIKDKIEEHGKTHKKNALIKAAYFYKLTGLPTLGEDSGIYIDAFPGELGVATRRWMDLGHVDDKKWIAEFMKRMKTVPKNQRGAKFICHAALIWKGKPHLFSGETKGIITEKLEAPIKQGLPLSSCFKPKGFDKVYNALTPKEKNRTSHRGKAMQKVRTFLLKLLTFSG